MGEDRVREPAWIDARLRGRGLWRPLLGLALGLGLLAVAARGVDLGELWAGLREADPGWVGLALLTVLLTTAAKVGRWRGLCLSLRGEGLRTTSLARALLVGQLVNALVPARLGEVARFTLLGRSEGVSKATVMGTIAAEKAFDVLFLLLTAGLTAAVTSLPPWAHGALGAMAALGGAVVAVALAAPRERLVAVGRRWAPRLPGGLGGALIGLVERGLAGLDALRRPRLAAAAAAWSALIWALAALTNLVVFWAFELPLSVGAALFLLTLLHLGMVPPSSPGRLGVFHAIAVFGLGTFGVERTTGLATATVLHAVVYAPQIALGSVALWLRPRTEEAGL